MRIALCGDVQLEASVLGKALLPCARNAGFGDLQVVGYQASLDLINAVQEPQPDQVIDMILCAYDLQGMTAVDMVADFTRKDNRPIVVVCSEDYSHAYDALQAGIAGYLLKPISESDLQKYVGALCTRAAEARRKSIDIQNGGFVCRIPLDTVISIQTSGHNQVIHRSGADDVSIRSTSTAMFDLVSHDARFFKVGSSNIINFDWLECTRSNGSVIHMRDGSVIDVPVRLKKPLTQALLDYH